jgi:hypothetical protein
MDGAEQTRALEQARLLERRGATQEAIKAYLNLGLPEDAVRAAASVGRFLEAARMALAHVPAQQDLGSLEGSPRRLAHRAALLLLEAGEHREALQLLLALGEREQARAAAERLGNVQITNFSGPGAPTMPPAGALAARARALEILESDPVGAEERRAFEQAAALLEAHGQRDAAEELRARLA